MDQCMSGYNLCCFGFIFASFNSLYSYICWSLPVVLHHWLSALILHLLMYSFIHSFIHSFSQSVSQTLADSQLVSRPVSQSVSRSFVQSISRSIGQSSSFSKVKIHSITEHVSNIC